MKNSNIFEKEGTADYRFDSIYETDPNNLETMTTNSGVVYLRGISCPNHVFVPFKLNNDRYIVNICERVTDGSIYTVVVKIANTLNFSKRSNKGTRLEFHIEESLVPFTVFRTVDVIIDNLEELISIATPTLINRRCDIKSKEILSYILNKSEVTKVDDKFWEDNIVSAYSRNPLKKRSVPKLKK